LTRTTGFFVGLAILTLAAWCWWYWPMGSSARLVRHEDKAFDFDVGHRLEVFKTPEELRAAYPDQWKQLAKDVDWNRDKLVRVRFTCPGYQTDEKVDGETRPGKVQFGQTAVAARFGGRLQRFYLSRPTPQLMGGPVHQCLQQQKATNWYAVPRSVEARLVSEPNDLFMDRFFVLGTVSLWTGAVLTRRRRKKAKAEPSPDATEMALDDESDENELDDSFDPKSTKNGPLGKLDESPVGEGVAAK